MKQNNNSCHGSKLTLAKRITAFTIAAISCFSVSALPNSSLSKITGNNTALAVHAAFSLEDSNYAKNITPSGMWVGGVGKLQYLSSIDLKPGAWYQSDNEKYVLIFQHDGNLVVYERQLELTFHHEGSQKIVGVKYGRVKCPIWSFKTNGQDGIKCTFQADGNLVVYRANGSVVRSTESKDDTSYLHFLELTDSGELRIRSYNVKEKYSRITFSSFDPKWR